MNFSLYKESPRRQGGTHRMKIAIVGSGIAGLTAAYWLYPDHEITVLESGAHVGGHVHTAQFELDGAAHAVDTGFIVYNERNYPLFSQLLAELDVATQPTSMSFSVHCARTDLEYRGADFNGLFAQRRNLLNPRFLRLLWDWQRFSRQAQRQLELASGDCEWTVGQFFERFPYSTAFIEQYFLPMASAIWSCPTQAVREFPIRFVVEFYRNHGLLSYRRRPQWRVIQGGSFRYVQKLIRPWRHRIRLRARVTSLRRIPEGVLVRTLGREPEVFDHVVMACHSDQALKILGPQATPTERAILSQFPYERNKVVLHWDERVLPRNRRAWASWNYYLPHDASDKAQVTYYMNRLQGIDSPRAICVTLNDTGRVRSDRVIREITYHHPVFTTSRTAAQARHPELIDHQGISYCGAYWGSGFHEDGVRSATAVVNRLRELPCKAAFMRAGCDTDGTSRSSTPFATASS